MTPRWVGRLTAIVALVSLLLLVVAVSAGAYVRNIQQQTAEEVATQIASLRAAQELDVRIRELRTQFDRYLISLERESYLNDVPALFELILKAIQKAEEFAISPDQKTIIARTRDRFEKFREKFEAIVNGPTQGLLAKIDSLINGEKDRRDESEFKKLFDPAVEYLRLNEGILSQTAQNNKDLTDRMSWGLIALGASGALAGLLCGTSVALMIRRSWLQVEQDLKNTTEQLQFVEQMAAGIAHEIRNPLMAIKLLVQATAERQGGGMFKARDYQVLEEEITRLEQIVNGFMDFARPTHPRLQPVDLGELVQKVINGMQARAQIQDVAVELTCPPESPQVLADPNQLQQVVFNLLFNALDAQPLGGKVLFQILPNPGTDIITLTIEDQGVGLPPALGERIFEPFVSTKESGMGLGLSICRRIIEEHGGKMKAANRPGGGASFAILLPAASSNKASLSSAETTPVPLTATTR